ncbi:hypothetical protein V8B97DRAFT_1888049 [Scleroderma yunnanense]
MHSEWLGQHSLVGTIHSSISDESSAVSASPILRISSLPTDYRDINVAFAGVDFTLLVYDYTLTLRREVELFWEKPRYSWGFSLFVANRYITILDHALQVTYSFWSPEIYSNFSFRVRCGPLRVAFQSIILVVQIIGGVIMIMRVHALYAGNRCILIFLVAVALGVIIFGAWALVAHAPTSLDYIPPSQMSRVGCPDSGYISSEQGIYLAAGWSGQLVFDLIVFLLTIVQSLRFRQARSRSIINILIRDGSLYFAIICAVNVANITVLLVGTVSYKISREMNRNLYPFQNFTKGVTGSFTNVISSIMISRLMLNLRDPKIAESTFGISLHPLSHADMAFAVPLAGTTDSENSGGVFEMQ